MIDLIPVAAFFGYYLHIIQEGTKMNLSMIKWSFTECALSIILILITVCFASAGTNAPGFSYKNKLLSANIKNQQLNEVLGQVAKTTGIEFVFNKNKIEENIFVEFKSMPVEKAIQRILNKFNYAVVYSPKGELKKVLIIGKRNGSSSTNIQTAVNSSPPSSGEVVKQTKTVDIKKIDAPEGMTLKYYSGKKYDNKIAEDMTITKQPKKPDTSNVVRFGTPAGNQTNKTPLTDATNRVVIENPSKQREKDTDLPNSMNIAKPVNATTGGGAPEGMTISSPPKTGAKTGS
jgi:type II secretory pathway component GspD/PulD (secretin)